ncbi:MAG: pyrroline-5-carboxylate reductase family protein, partial [Vicinamibacteria bacterium]
MKIGIIGAGNMGQALLRGLVRGKGVRPSQIGVTDVDRRRVSDAAGEVGAVLFGSNAEAAARSDLLVLAVKPQTLPDVLSEIRSHVSS